MMPASKSGTACNLDPKEEELHSAGKNYQSVLTESNLVSETNQDSFKQIKPPTFHMQHNLLYWP